MKNLKELIGEQLGQFHSDFNVKNKHDKTKKIENLLSKQFICLGKKAYFDHLFSKTKEDQENMKTEHHIRMKGIPISCITNPIETYINGYEGKILEFDLMKATSSIFGRNSDFTYSRRTSFTRTVKF